MTVIKALILGVVQGLTEFLPISSSGHLVIMQALFGIETDNLVMEIVVHCGTLLSVLVIFWQDIKGLVAGFFQGITRFRKTAAHDPYFRLLGYLIIGTLPAAAVGLLGKEQIEAIFHSTKLVGFTLIVTGFFLSLTYFIAPTHKQPNWWRSLIIGSAQAFAILPGISRSGATIAAGLFVGLKKEEATRFSFLLSIPAILGALVLNLKDLFTQQTQGMSWLAIITGLVSAFVVGYLAIRFLLRIVSQGKLAYFAPYCLAVGLLVLVFLT